MTDVTVVNKTLYNSQDLARMIHVVAHDAYRLPMGELCNKAFLVNYFTPPGKPYGDLPSGPFVKFNRNGDENKSIKKISLVRPEKFNCPDLMNLASVASSLVPVDFLHELILRIKAILYYSGGGANVLCTDRSAVPLPHVREANRRLIEDHGLVLRFSLRGDA